MENSTLISLISGIFGLVGIIVATLVGYRQTKITANSADQQTNISGVSTAIQGLDTLAKQHTVELQRVATAHDEYVAKCDKDRISFSNQIAHQAGEISVLKTIPLTDISSTLDIISKANKSLAESNSKILERLEASAATLATDTEAAAQKVEEVKTDLHEDDANKTRLVKDNGK